MNPSKVYFAPMIANDLGLAFQDKRNRNPNWTDHEIIRFLEILQEDDILKDLMAQRNKQVFCQVAQRMTTEGSEKTWDQCRIKLKNLKSQYRYVKDRIPNIDTIDLDDEEVVKQLIAECQGRGISPSNIKHLRYLRRFLQKTSDLAAGHLKVALEVRTEVLGASGGPASLLSAPGGPSSKPISVEQSFSLNEDDHNTLVIDETDSVSPPSTPASQAKLVILDKDEDDSGESPVAKKKKKTDEAETLDNFTDLLNGSITDGYRFIEKFNREMMDQFLEYQRRSSTSYMRWERERHRQEQLAVEQWRQESREHEKQMFGIFCSAISKCNSALNIMLKLKQDASDEAKKLKRKSTNDKESDDD